MIKRTITETIEEYDTNGNLIRKITTKTEEEDKNYPTPPIITTYPWIPVQPLTTTCSTETSCDACNK